MPELVDKVILVTGATSGIGQAIAVEFAKAGAKVAVSGRNAAKLQAFVDFANSHGGHLVSFPADLASVEGRDALAKWALEQLGGVDVLVHAAGIAHAGSSDLSDAVFDAMFQINVTAAHSLVNRLQASLIARRGQIVFINSRGGVRVMPNCTAYSATKFALRAYADGLREELRPHGVRVLSVCPGKTDTPMLRDLFAEIGSTYEAAKYARSEDIARATLDALMLPRHIEIPEFVLRPFQD